jgi:hypothetical protein
VHYEFSTSAIATLAYHLLGRHDELSGKIADGEGWRVARSSGPGRADHHSRTAQLRRLEKFEEARKGLAPQPLSPAFRGASE